jgi:hypothetical protein
MGRRAAGKHLIRLARPRPSRIEGDLPTRRGSENLPHVMRTGSAYPVSLMALLPLCAVRADLPTRVDITDIEGCAADRAAVVKG